MSLPYSLYCDRGILVFILEFISGYEPAYESKVQFVSGAQRIEGEIQGKIRPPPSHFAWDQHS